MNKKDIKQMIDLLPTDVLNSINKTQHFFYGKSRNLDCLEDDIVKKYKDAMSLKENDSLLITLGININEDSLINLSNYFQEISTNYEIEYDGFQMLLENQDDGEFNFLPFEDFFEPNSYIKIKLSNDKYAYLLYIGGNKLDGYFFECLSLMNNGTTSPEILDKTPRIFRQPIQGFLNPECCVHVGAAQAEHLPIEFSFRLLENNTTQEQVDELYRYYSINELEENSWLLILEKVLQDNSKHLVCKSTMKYKITINKKGKPRWSNLLPLSIEETTPMPFGSILDYNKFNNIFVEGINELDLIDRVSKA